MISYAHLHHRDESKTYAILSVLLASYTDLFSSDDPGVSIFTTPQDRSVGQEELHAAPHERPVCVIPDMTVKIARRDGDSIESESQVVLVIEAKRLCVETAASELPISTQP